MKALAATLVLLLAAVAPAEATMLCRWTGICLYLSPGFTITVVDAETGKPLADVYGWAEWTQYGAHGRGGPLMVQDATSAADGRLSFPRWGPTFGSRGGLLLGFDPSVILFKPGYATLLVQNGVPLGASHHAAIRGMSRNGETLRLQPFKGTPAESVEELRKLVYPALSAYVPDAERDRFRVIFLRRTTIVAVELGKFPREVPEVVRLQASLERSVKFFREGAP